MASYRHPSLKAPEGAPIGERVVAGALGPLCSDWMMVLIFGCRLCMKWYINFVIASWLGCGVKNWGLNGVLDPQKAVFWIWNLPKNMMEAPRLQALLGPPFAIGEVRHFLITGPHTLFFGLGDLSWIWLFLSFSLMVVDWLLSKDLFFFSWSTSGSWGGDCRRGAWRRCNPQQGGGPGSAGRMVEVRTWANNPSLRIFATKMRMSLPRTGNSSYENSGFKQPQSGISPVTLPLNRQQLGMLPCQTHLDWVHSWLWGMYRYLCLRSCVTNQYQCNRFSRGFRPLILVEPTPLRCLDVPTKGRVSGDADNGFGRWARRNSTKRPALVREGTRLSLMGFQGDTVESETGCSGTLQ